MEPDDTFSNEIEWCVSQLLIGLIRGSPNPEQIKESKRVIDKLQGSKLSYVSKRQLMNVVFGDYRKRMKESSLQQLREELAKHNLPLISSQYNIKLKF
jgi:Domain of unknown function (DUF4615)